ncbi:MAG TPA: shikimate dehydrogenase [Anaerolineaceae bacterium]
MENSRLYHFGLIGYPLEHSLSPQIHHAALRACCLEGEYHLFLIPPGPEAQVLLAEKVTALREGRLQGFNVTIPHKQNLLPLVDELTATASEVGAVNTVFLRDGKVVGENTDVPGFYADLQGLVHTDTPQRALVLGAGGSARAAVYALLRAGWDVQIAARRLEQAQALAGAFPRLPGRASALPFDLLEFPKNFALLVNTTPLGMYPKVDGCPWSEIAPLPEGCAVYDLIYNPPETRLMQNARISGHPVRNGLGMLIEQAALAFEIWTGKSAPRQAMRAAAEQ